jgi:hypothetical protein
LLTLVCHSGLNVRATWRSKTDKGGGKAPNWNEKHSFDIIEGDDRLQVQVFDEDTVSDDLIGSVVIDLKCSPSAATFIWFIRSVCCPHTSRSCAFQLTFFFEVPLSDQASATSGSLSPARAANPQAGPCVLLSR